jgi:hypothetical protein
LNLGYCFILLLVLFYRFKKYLYTVQEDIDIFSALHLKFTRGGLHTYQQIPLEVIEQTVNAFGVLPDSTKIGWQISLDGQSMIKGPRLPFLYLPNEDDIPAEMTAGNLLTYFKKKEAISNEVFAKVKEGLSEILPKRFGNLTQTQKVELLITMAEMKNETEPSIILFKDLGKNLPFYLVEDLPDRILKLSEGSIFLLILRSDLTAWIPYGDFHTIYPKEGKYTVN